MGTHLDPWRRHTTRSTHRPMPTAVPRASVGHPARLAAAAPGGRGEISIALDRLQRTASVQRGFCGGFAPQKPLIRLRRLRDAKTLNSLFVLGPSGQTPLTSGPEEEAAVTLRRHDRLRCADCLEEWESPFAREGWTVAAVVGGRGLPMQLVAPFLAMGELRPALYHWLS